MKKQIPDFLIEMSKQMNEQDNRMTAEPIFEVRCKRSLTCADGREDFWIIVDSNNEYTEIFNSDELDDSYFFEYMEENYPEWVREWEDANEMTFSDDFDVRSDYHDLPSEHGELERLPMQYIEETVKSCLTESDANDFIKRKQHDHPKLYTYVSSMIYCPQMIELRNWIKGLSED